MRFLDELRFACQVGRARAESFDLPDWAPVPQTMEERERDLYEELTRDLESELGLKDGDLQPVVEKKYSADGGTLLPCSNCGAEMWDGEDTTKEVGAVFEFGGKEATREIPAKVCPECDEVVPI